MKLVMLGGTFNPPHMGHLFIAEAVRDHFSYDNLVLVPSFFPAHKEIKDNVSYTHRRKMVELSILNRDKIFISDCENERKGISYSLDTIRFLKEAYTAGEKPGLIIGDDLVPGFSKWYKAELLAQEADIIICHRGEASQLNFPYPHLYFQNPVFRASSTDIRKILEEGNNPEGLIDPEVLKYIQKEHLYGT
jgi:nicotinate-nucleotide adenylyltransferase